MLIGLIGALVATSLAGSAASLAGLDPGVVGAAGAPVVACDTNGFTVSYVTSDGNVTSATVAGIADPGCEGGRLSLTLADLTAALGSGGPQLIATDADGFDNSVTVAISPQPAATLVTRVHVSIVGP